MWGGESPSVVSCLSRDPGVTRDTICPQVVEVAPRLHMLDALLSAAPYGDADSEEEAAAARDGDSSMDDAGAAAGPRGLGYTLEELLDTVQVGCCWGAELQMGRVVRVPTVLCLPELFQGRAHIEPMHP